MKPQEPSLSMFLTELLQLRADLQAVQKRLLTVEDAAAYLGLSIKTIRNGLGPRAKKPFPVKLVKLAERVIFKREQNSYIKRLGAAG